MVCPQYGEPGYLESLQAKLSGYQLAVEFRIKLWMEADRDPHRTLGFLRANQLTYVNLDMPQGFKSSLPATAEVTDPKLAMVRLRPRPRGLDQEDRAGAVRYRYTPDELQAWVPRIERLAENAEQLQALMDNCYSYHAVVAARQLSALLHGEDPEAAAAPGQLADR